MASVPDLAQYIRARERFIRDEQNRFLGSHLTLSPLESAVNDGLMFAKRNEMLFPPKEGFPPSRVFMNAKKDIEASSVFDFIRRLPKGAALHGHDLSMASSEWVIANVTYRPHLFVRGVSPQHRVNNAPLEFKFMPQMEGGQSGDKVAPGDWHRLSTVRTNSGNVILFDKWLSEQLTLDITDFQTRYKTTEDVWKAFEQRFQVLFSLLTYRPVFEDYYRQVLKEHMEDNVQYLEMRAVLPEVYNDDGSVLSPVEVAELYANITKQFVEENKDRFFGARVIFAPRRFVPPSDIQDYAKLLDQLKERVGDFVIGFDLVGQEDQGRPLIDFAGELLQMAPKTKFFFHAGETNAHGWTDENMVDAILLNTTRMGHGFALTIHPAIIEEMNRRDIAVEVNPISNQVLLLVSDLRDHPACVLLADNAVPIVIGSDDPGLWGAKALSYDWYQAFVGMTHLKTDLRMLKQLAINSINYSALAPADKQKLMTLWNKQWNSFIQHMSAPDKNALPNEI